jgi:hypothetical protein
VAAVSTPFAMRPLMMRPFATFVFAMRPLMILPFATFVFATQPLMILPLTLAAANADVEQSVMAATSRMIFRMNVSLFERATGHMFQKQALLIDALTWSTTRARTDVGAKHRKKPASRVEQP